MSLSPVLAALPFGGNFSYSGVFGGLHDGCMQLRDVLMPFGFVLVIIGTIMTFQSAGSPTNKLVSVAFLVALVGTMSVWKNQDGGAIYTARHIVHDDLLGDGGLKAPDNKKVFTGMLELMAVESLSGGPVFAFNPSTGGNNSTFSQMLFSGMYLFGVGAMIVLWAATMVQKALLDVSVGLGPLLFGMLAVPQLRGTGWNFLQTTLAVLLWPVGWGIVNFGAQGLIQNALKIVGPSALASVIAGSPDMAPPAVTMQEATRLVWTAVVAGYVTISIPGVPFLIGALVGGAAHGLGQAMPVGGLGGAFGGGAHGGHGGGATAGAAGANTTGVPASVTGMGAASTASAPVGSSGSSGTTGDPRTSSSASNAVGGLGGRGTTGASSAGSPSSVPAGGAARSAPGGASGGSPLSPSAGGRSATAPGGASASAGNGGGVEGGAPGASSASGSGSLPAPSSPSSSSMPIGMTPRPGDSRFPIVSNGNGQPSTRHVSGVAQRG